MLNVLMKLCGCLKCKNGIININTYQKEQMSEFLHTYIIRSFTKLPCIPSSIQVKENKLKSKHYTKPKTVKELNLMYQKLISPIRKYIHLNKYILISLNSNISDDFNEMEKNCSNQDHIQQIPLSVEGSTSSSHNKHVINAQEYYALQQKCIQIKWNNEQTSSASFTEDYIHNFNHSVDQSSFHDYNYQVNNIFPAWNRVQNIPKTPQNLQRRYYSDIVKSHSPNDKVNVVKQVLDKMRYEKSTPYGIYIKKGWLDKKGKIGLFKVVSYNLLAQSLLEEHRGYLYSYHNDNYLTWSYRSKLILKELQDFDADILCLQEVDSDHWTFYSEYLDRLGYKGYFKKRTNDKPDGCAIFYRESVFELKELSAIEYYQPNCRNLNRDNIGIVGRFYLKDSKKSIVVATTHLLFNPRRHDIKLFQIQMLLAEIERIAFKNYNENGNAQYEPIILTGDFNLQPDTDIYQFLINGVLNYNDEDRFSLQPLPHQLNINEECQHAEVIKNRQNPRNEISDFKHVRLYNSERKSLWKILPNESRNNENFNSTHTTYRCGTLRHNLKLTSVYLNNDSRLATTYHDKWCTVDYILYGPTKLFDNKMKMDGELKLISYLRLPSNSEAELLDRIPNKVCGSDHLPLVGTFHLPPDF